MPCDPSRLRAGRFRDNRVAAALFLATAGVFGAAGAARAESPWYVTGAAGASLRLDAARATTFSNAAGLTGPGTTTATYDPGPAIALAAGYRLGGGFRIEGEFGYEHYALSTVDPLSLNGAFPALVGNTLARQSGGGRDAYLATVSALRDLRLTRRVGAFVGVGAGVENDGGPDAHFAGPGGSPVFTQRKTDLTFAALVAQAGLTIALDRRWTLVPSYRFEHLFTTGNNFADETNVVRLGLRYAF